ncbi:aconitate hydratase AcnA [Carnimonas bestiolae]|uniref:aconitate hydratase AcnA n=1 Tax=Carnimonas bestiolae TaxID=3402172 RepID=UPI003EDBC251
MSSQDPANTFAELPVGDKRYGYYSLARAEEAYGDISKLPFTLKVLLENQLRNIDGTTTTEEDAKALVEWQQQRRSTREIGYRPARVLMQDFTGVPAVVDLAAMRDAVAELGGDPKRINPLSPVDLVIDHSVMVDRFGNAEAFDDNVEIEMERNHERYQFLRWGQQAFDDFSVVPPGTGICHQVNLEYLGKSVWTRDIDGKTIAYPDTLVGTDSHTTMINALGVLGWGVGGIEAEAAMLGQPVSMLIPEVVGFKLTGKLKEGITATDLVLTVVQMLREKGVVGKFVEFYGDGLKDLPLADRATIANMAPEYGATCGFFPVDEETLRYMQLTGRSQEQIDLVEAYTKEQGLWRLPGHEPVFTDTLALDMSDVESSLAGPKRPQDRVALSAMTSTFRKILADSSADASQQSKSEWADEGGSTAPYAIDAYYENPNVEHEGQRYRIDDGAVVIAAITSCTNTSNPSVMLAAGLLAQKAVAKGLSTKPWVKTSLAPGSKVVTDYLSAAGLNDSLDKLGFNLVGYGCTTCIGNSGPLAAPIEQAIQDHDLTVAGVLSGNRNFEGRIHPLVQTNWLASPPLVVAYALAGNLQVDLSKDALGHDSDGNPVYLKDIWPSQAEIADAVEQVKTDMYRKEYAAVFEGTESWRSIDVTPSESYQWSDSSTYIQNPPFFSGMQSTPSTISDIKGARVLLKLADSVTTDHISPAGAIKQDSPAGRYLQEHGVEPIDFNSYGSRRGNFEVMTRGTFANVRIRNEMLDDVVGGYTRYVGDGPQNGEQMAVYDAAVKYAESNTPLVVVAGKEYGTGSSRDWAAKGTNLLGVRAVIAESFERIHRSNLIGMGVLPLQFPEGQDRNSLGLTGDEVFSITDLASMEPGGTIKVTIERQNGETFELDAKSRIDTGNELEYYRHGGILHYVLRSLLSH